MKKSIVFAFLILLFLTGCGTSASSSGSFTAGGSSGKYEAYSSTKETGEPLTIEKIEIEPFELSTVEGATWIKWSIKVRNTSGSDLDSGKIRITYLDENKDILDTYLEILSDTKAGQASTEVNSGSYSSSWGKSEFDAVKYMTIEEYIVDSSQHAQKFKEPIIIEIKK